MGNRYSWPVGRALLAAALVAGVAAAQAQRGGEQRWRASEQCGGRPSGRTYVLTSDGSVLTARLAGTSLDSFGSILGFTPLLPGGRFTLDIAVGQADSKVNYNGRVHDNGQLTAEGGQFVNDAFTPCRLTAMRFGDPAPAPARRPTQAGKPEPIPSNRTSAGRPEPIPGPVGSIAAPRADLPACSEPGPAPSALGADGQWRPTCIPQGSAVARPAPAPAPAPAPSPPPVAVTPPPTAPASSRNEVEALRQQLEEERRRREAAERAMRLNEALGRQGRN